jgi:GGDEF domain-containing protein
MDELIRSADAAMYAAKRAGGNQTRICRPARVDR